MKRLTAIMLAVMVMFTMTACVATPNNTNTGDNPLVGTWKGEVDYAGVINALIGTDETLTVSGVTVDTAPVGVTYVFDENGKVTCSVDEEALYTVLMNTAKEILGPMIGALMGTDVETYLAQSADSGKEMLMSLFPAGFVDQVEGVFTFTGSYTLDGDTLSVAVDKHVLKSAVELGDGTLTLQEPVGVNMASNVYQEAVNVLYPLVLSKA